MRQLRGPANPGSRHLSGGVGTRWKARPQARLPAPRLTIRRRAEMVQDSSISNRKFPDERPGIGDKRRTVKQFLDMRLLLGLMLVAPAPAQDRSQARSMVLSDRGIVATSQTLASQAGAQVLARGGSAIDAAIAANATLGVVEPERGGIGGDLFVIYYEAVTGKLIGLNASGWAPQGLSIELLKSMGNRTMPQLGIHSVTVPGCVDGWEKLHGKFGKLPWKDLFAPAIYYARNGFPVTEIIHETWHEETAKLAADANAQRVYLPGGESPTLGKIFRNPELGAAMELIAREGAAAFYQGAIARAILKTGQKLGGTMSAADLSEFSSERVQPIWTEYRGWKVYELPPNGQGVGPLEMLNILAQFPLGRYAPRGVEELHAQIEAQKLTFADLHRYLGDPRMAHRSEMRR